MLNGKIITLTPDIPPNARRWRNDPEVWAWCRQHTLIDEAGHQEWLYQQARDATIKMFGIMYGLTDVGVCGLTSIDRQNQTAEFSLYIAPDSRGKGYATDALKTLLRHGFYDWNLNRIWGESFEGNPALKMFGKLGFKGEGVLRQAYFRQGKFIDAFIVSMLREEFKDEL